MVLVVGCVFLWYSVVLVVSHGICGDLVLRGVLWCAVLCSVLSFSVVSCGVVFCSVLSHGVPGAAALFTLLVGLECY